MSWAETDEPIKMPFGGADSREFNKLWVALITRPTGQTDGRIADRCLPLDTASEMINPPALREAQAMRAYVLLFFKMYF